MNRYQETYARYFQKISERHTRELFLKIHYSTKNGNGKK